MWGRVTSYRAMGVAVCALSSALSPLAFGQDTSVPALARIAEQEPSLAVSLSSRLNFYTVNRPNGTKPGAVCRYQINANYPAGDQVDELNASGSVIQEGMPTPSGCGAGGASRFDGRVGLLSVQCQPGLVVIVRTSYQPTTARTGVEFSSPDDLHAIGIAQNSGVLGATPGNSVGTTCPEREGSNDFNFLVTLGGQLELDETADVTEGRVEVGTIVVEVDY